MVYWADMLYESPVPADTGQESSQLELERIVESEAADMTWLADIPDDERDFVEDSRVRSGWPKSPQRPMRWRRIPSSRAVPLSSSRCGAQAAAHAGAASGRTPLPL